MVIVHMMVLGRRFTLYECVLPTRVSRFNFILISNTPYCSIRRLMLIISFRSSSIVQWESCDGVSERYLSIRDWLAPNFGVSRRGVDTRAPLRLCRPIGPDCSNAGGTVELKPPHPHVGHRPRAKECTSPNPWVSEYKFSFAYVLLTPILSFRDHAQIFLHTCTLRYIDTHLQ